MRGLIRLFGRWIIASPLCVFLIRYRRERSKRQPYVAYKNMESFGYGNLSDAEKKAMFEDMRRCLKEMHFSYYEYLAYNFVEKKTDEERLAFISSYERKAIIRKMNRRQDVQIFGRKTKVAEKFSAFLNREFLAIESPKDVAKLEVFLNKHKRAIVKPVSDSWGRGVKIVNVKAGDDVHKLASELVQEYANRRSGRTRFGGIVEEVVDQDERLAVLHPQSVNSVRITTFRLDSRTIVFEPFLRVGRGDACVDNAGAGGIMCPVHLDTGVVFTARDKHGVSYDKHPETGVQLVGFQVPRWNEALEFVRKAAQVVPTTRVIGWDVALSRDGWVLIEANNAGEWVTQEATQHGLRSKVNEILQEFNQ